METPRTELSTGALVYAIQGLDRLIVDHIEEINALERDKKNGLEEAIVLLDGLNHAAHELEDLYKERSRRITNMPPYETLVTQHKAVDASKFSGR